MSVFSQLRRGVLGVIGSMLVFVGLFLPWLWQGCDPYYTFNYTIRRYETHYNGILEISPLCARSIELGVLKSLFWFYDLSLSVSLAAIGLIVGAVLCLISFGRWRVSLTGWFFYIISFMLFLYSFSIGWLQTLGRRTFIGLGLWVTIVGGIVMFASAIVDLTRKEEEK